MSWKKEDLAAQYARVKAAGWLDYFSQSADTHNFDMEELLAIGSRETSLQNIKGDFRGGIYHGYGVMQVDISTDPDFCHTWTPDKVQASIERGTQILAGKRAYLAQHHVTDPKDYFAAYNCGQGVVAFAALHHQDPDIHTTGGDYGRDVCARRDIFAGLLDADPDWQRN